MEAKQKKNKKKKPKGRTSAFIYFGNATRAEIKAEHPDWSLGEVGRELGKRWKELDDAAKQPFRDLAAKDAERYKTEMEAKQKKNKKKKPKGRTSAFIYFGNATRAEIKAEHPDWSLGEVGRELGKRWKELDDAAKQPFHDLAAKDPERYKTEMEAKQKKDPNAPKGR